jgi:BirA family transcriptional regulator, biotin operon repressor / biotin---[acetyl-CoA-carboxylase] ligase
MLKLSKKKILLNLSKTVKGQINKLDVFSKIKSTNEYLLNCKLFHKNNLVCISDEQTAGYGRRGNKWVSPADSNIYLSVCWHFLKEPQDISTLSLATAIKVVESLEFMGFKNIKIKWPNDLFCEQKKLGGILIERKIVKNRSMVVIGIGINCHMEANKNIEKTIKQDWIDLAACAKKKNASLQPVDRNIILSKILNLLIPMLAKYHQTGFTDMQEKWQQLDLLFNKQITTSNNIFGVANGVDKKGRLKIKTPIGNQFISSENVSIMKQKTKE